MSESVDPLLLSNGVGSGSAGIGHLVGTGAVYLLERRLAEYFSANYALCFSSATAALDGIALALGIEGGEFLTQAFLNGPSIAPWMRFSDNVVFADIEPETLSLSPDAARVAISERTKAILAVDVLGFPSDSRALRTVADDAGIWYIADSCQALGARRDGLPASSHAHAIVLSFSYSKLIFGGEGGLVVTNERDLYERLIWHTQHPLRQKRELGLAVCNEFALNGRIHPRAAEAALESLESVFPALRRWQERCRRVLELLASGGIAKPESFDELRVMPSYNTFSVELQERVSRREMLFFLESKGINATISSLPCSVILENPVFNALYSRKYIRPSPCVVAERAQKRIALSYTGVRGMTTDDKCDSLGRDSGVRDLGSFW
ncbi:MAG: DegT/DnrJ/EryC1/StrS family aminotransferase [Aridibacter famidurans]|nr:DegT/DnrJ/EryC1/StrS family aminotransferase [Aridibacter famidurans]